MISGQSAVVCIYSGMGHSIGDLAYFLSLEVTLVRFPTLSCNHGRNDCRLHIWNNRDIADPGSHPCRFDNPCLLVVDVAGCFLVW